MAAETWRYTKSAGRFTPRYTFKDSTGAIFTMSPFGVPGVNGDEIARLLVAAPEMRAALLDVKAAHDGADTDWMRAVKAALAKAGA